MYRNGKNRPAVTCSFCGKSAEQVDKMTPAEIERNLDKIHKSMRRW